MDWNLFILVFAPLGRALAGWLQNAFADNEIDWPEWQQLFSTLLRLGVPSAALFFGFGMPVELASAIVIVGDYVFSYAKKLIDRWATTKITVERTLAEPVK